MDEVKMMYCVFVDWNYSDSEIYIYKAPFDQVEIDFISEISKTSVHSPRFYGWTVDWHEFKLEGVYADCNDDYTEDLSHVFGPQLLSEYITKETNIKFIEIYEGMIKKLIESWKKRYLLEYEKNHILKIENALKEFSNH